MELSPLKDRLCDAHEVTGIGPIPKGVLEWNLTMVFSSGGLRSLMEGYPEVAHGVVTEVDYCLFLPPILHELERTVKGGTRLD